MQLGPTEIAALLRHRYPFLLVDRIVELDAERAVGIKNVSIAEPFVPGHFPEQPIFPGVLLLEAMSQVGGVLLAHAPPFPGGSGGGFLAAIDKVKFKRPVVPGDQLVIEAALTAAVKPFARVRATAAVGGEEVAAGEISYFLA
jgi:3-hydroxyacyl-[acyl-carrier-protein] dehydratase